MLFFSGDCPILGNIQIETKYIYGGFMLFYFLAGCNIIGIEDGWNHGNVTQIKDFFTSTLLKIYLCT